ncbi:MAG: flagellar biosynthesis anti-sigma factor FlgM [Candidatus Aminicenantes bacterium]|nr:flagellar biosynthesis anti-sigma factor FlgM [Candidatus Aminicenantes bacterium]
MKVSTNTDGVDKISAEYIRKDLKKVKQSGQENRAENDASEDRVEISSKAFDLNTLQAAAMQAPDVRTGKVADIKNRVDNNTYKISYEELAERLMEDAWMA